MSLQPTHTRGLSSFPLKLIAIIGMTCNHASWIFESSLPGWAFCVLNAVGGITFPTMAFLLVVGYTHTSNIKRYILRLLVFACIAQIPYSLFLAHQVNVLFTLLVGLGLLYCHDKLTNRAVFCAVFALAIFGTFWFDWGVMGPLMIYLAYTLPTKLTRALVPICIPAVVQGLAALSLYLQQPTIQLLATMLYVFIGCPIAGVCVLTYNGKHGLPLKWFFYAYYPLHIAVLGIIYVVITGTLPAVL